MKFDFVPVDIPESHPKKIILILFLVISALQTYTQDHIIAITGTYQKTPLKFFVADIESRYTVRFFYDEESLDTLTVTSNFKQTPLEECLEQILDKRVIQYFISGNEIILYPGLLISELFPGGDISVYNAREIQLGKKISREDLDQIQYQIINIGTPGKNKSNTATLTGHLRNFESGEPVIGGNIYTSDKHLVTSSDATGLYRIILPVGSHVLNFSSIGMEQVKRNIKVYSDGMLDVDMFEKVDILEDAVIIGHGEGNVGQIHAGMERIDIITIKSIPALLGEADIMKSVLTLPGVQSVGEGTSGFNVRGGDTDQNLILIDQAPIYYPSHFFGNFSSINSEIIEDATLYKGSIPVKYGGRISSVFEINTIDGNHEKISGSAGISPISMRLNIDGPLLSKKSTFIASFRSTYSNWILTRIKVPELYKSKAGFYDALVKLNLSLNDKNRLVISFYNSNDKFQLHSDTSYNYNNLIASLSLKHEFNPRLKSSSSLICSLFKYEISNKSSLDQSFSLTHNLNNIALIHDFDLFTSGRMKYGFGAAFNFFSINPGERNALNNSNIIPVNSMNERAIEFGIYAGSEYHITGSLKLEGGIRLSGLSSFDDGKKYMYAADMPYEMDNITDTIYSNRNRISKTFFRPEWRLSLNYSAGRNSSIKFSYNKTSQYIHMLSNTMAISPTDTWKLSDVYLLPETGNQISAGFFQNFLRNRVEASAEVFYKLVDNIKEYKPGSELLLNDHVETEIVNGKGKSYGIELSLVKSGGRVYGRIDYTYSRTWIKSVSRFTEELINDGEYFPANYDKPHNLNVLANLKASRRFIISATINYSTGRPVTYPISKYQLGEQVFLQYSKYNQYRLTDYFRTDLSATLNGNLKKHQRTHSSLTFSLYNVTGRKNAYSIYFKSEGGKFVAYQLSIFGTVIPTLSYNIRF